MEISECRNLTMQMLPVSGGSQSQAQNDFLLVALALAPTFFHAMKPPAM